MFGFTGHHPILPSWFDILQHWILMELSLGALLYKMCFVFPNVVQHGHHSRTYFNFEPEEFIEDQCIFDFFQTPTNMIKKGNFDEKKDVNKLLSKF